MSGRSVLAPRLPRLLATLAVAALGVALTALVACGSDAASDGDGAASGTSDLTVGADGGTLSALGGTVTLEVPAGALGEDVEITVEEGSVDDLPAEIADVMQVSQVLSFGPDGLTFDQPVRVSLQVPLGEPGEDGGEAPLPVLLMRNEEGISFPANQHAAVDLDTGMVTLSGEITHFSEVWDNLPRDGGIRVRFSGVPSEWRVGEGNKFTVRTTIMQTAESDLHFIDVTFSSWNNSPIRPWIICEDGCDMGVIDSNRAQTLSREDEYFCAEAGQGRWTADVRFGDTLAQAVYSFLGGANTSLNFFDRGPATYTSEAFRSIRCVGDNAAGTQTPGVPLDPVRLSSLRSELRFPVTTYAIAVVGPGNLTFEWSMTGEACGTPRVPWTQTGPIVQWSHSEEAPDNCTHLTANHDVVVTVTVKQDGVEQFKCTIRGSESQFPDWNTSCDPPQGTR